MNCSSHSATPILALRALEPEDLELLYAWENVRECWFEANTVQPWTRETLKRYIAQIQDIYTDRQLRLMITLDGQPTGLFDLYDFDPRHGRAGIGILIGEEALRGQGWGKQALAAGIQYASEHLLMRVLYAHIAESNAASQALFAAEGFQRVATFPAWLAHPDGAVDVHHYQLNLM